MVRYQNRKYIKPQTVALIRHLQLLALVILILCFINSGYHIEFHITEINLKYVNFLSMKINLNLRQSWISVMSQKSCKGWGEKKNTTFRGRQSPGGTLSPPHTCKHTSVCSCVLMLHLWMWKEKTGKLMCFEVNKRPVLIAHPTCLDSAWILSNSNYFFWMRGICHFGIPLTVFAG